MTKQPILIAVVPVGTPAYQPKPDAIQDECEGCATLCWLGPNGQAARKTAEAQDLFAYLICPGCFAKVATAQPSEPGQLYSLGGASNEKASPEAIQQAINYSQQTRCF